MPDYGDKKGFQGSGKGQAATGGQKKGQGGGYNAPGPQYGGSLADTQNKLGTKYSPELAAAITASNKAAFDKKTQRDFINRMADLEASSGQKKSFGQGLKKFGQGIMQNITPGRMIASTIGSALLGPVGGILAGLLANRATTDAFKTDVRDTINFFRPNFNVDTPDADIVRAGDFNVMDRITGAIAAPNISTGLQTLFAPRALGLPEDFLDQSAVQTQQLDPVAIGMQYDDFINPNTGMFFDPDRGFIQ